MKRGPAKKQLVEAAESVDWLDHLPRWAKMNPASGMIEIDPDVVYPLFLKVLGYEKVIAQTTLESARLCFTHLLHTVVGNNMKTMRVRILKRPKWRLDKYKPGPPVGWIADYNRAVAPNANYLLMVGR
jgi:hypothetical protein